MNMYLHKIHDKSFLISHETWHTTGPLQNIHDAISDDVICASCYQFMYIFFQTFLLQLSYCKTRNVGGYYIWRFWKYHNLAKI